MAVIAGALVDVAVVPNAVGAVAVVAIVADAVVAVVVVDAAIVLDFSSLIFNIPSVRTSQGRDFSNV